MFTVLKKKYFFLSSIFLFLAIVLLKANKVVGLINNEDYFFYTKQALINGINISRGYGELLNANPIYGKIFFNKAFYLIYYVFNALNIIYDRLVSLMLVIVN